MKILVINPNTSDNMTDDIKKTVMTIKSDDIDVKVVHLDFGPESLESFYDYSLSAFGSIRLITNSDEKYDGILLACYGDPGLYALKEMCDCPVFGIAEASIAMSTLLGYKFAILAASEKAVPMMDNMVEQYGFGKRFVGVYPIQMNVLDAEKNKSKTISKLISVGKEAIKNGAEVLILGCAGMTGMKEEVEEALGLTILDPVEVSYLQLETIVKNKIKSSKRGLYSKPMIKNILKQGLLEDRK